MSSPNPTSIEFYDLPSVPPNTAWSPNPWKIRLVLNYKSLPYHTTWVEYPRIAPLFTSFSVHPNSEGIPYTIPVIKLPDGRYLMDSLKIAQELERLYPEPSLRLENPVVEQVAGLVLACLGTLKGVLLPMTARNLLNEESREFWKRTKAEILETKVDKEEVWGEANQAFRKMGELLREREGPFFGGEVGFADFIVVGVLGYFKRIGEGLFERVIGIEPALEALYEACRPWLERNDH